MASRPTNRKDPTSATYSVLSQAVSGCRDNGEGRSTYRCNLPRNGTGIVKKESGLYYIDDFEHKYEAIAVP